MFKTIEWTPEGVVMIDQRLLPNREVYATCRTSAETAEAIRGMLIRVSSPSGSRPPWGSPRAWPRSRRTWGSAERTARFEAVCECLSATRPTAVNLFWAIRRMRKTFAALDGRPWPEVAAAMAREAVNIHLEDVEAAGASATTVRCSSPTTPPS